MSVDDAHPRRYVVLRHEGVERPHYDLMIETDHGQALATWRSDVWPVNGDVQLAALPAHRRAYLEYEGPVSGGRGVVRRVEGGTCLVNIQSDGAWLVNGDCSTGRKWSITLRSVESKSAVGGQ